VSSAAPAGRSARRAIQMFGQSHQHLSVLAQSAGVAIAVPTIQIVIPIASIARSTQTDPPHSPIQAHSALSATTISSPLAATCAPITQARRAHRTWNFRQMSSSIGTLTSALLNQDGVYAIRTSPPSWMPIAQPLGIPSPDLSLGERQGCQWSLMDLL
jgi:hypothetical protein